MDILWLACLICRCWRGDSFPVIVGDDCRDNHASKWLKFWSVYRSEVPVQVPI